MDKFEAIGEELLSLIEEWEPKLSALGNDVITERRNSLHWCERSQPTCFSCHDFVDKAVRGGYSIGNWKERTPRQTRG